MIFTVFRWFFREFAQNPVFGPGALGRNPEDSGVLVRLQSARGSARMEETFVKQKEGGPVDFLLNYVTFALAAVGWIIFRAETIGDAWRYVRRIFSPAILDRVALGGSYESPGIHAAVGVAILLAVEWSQRTRQHGLQLTGRAHISRRSVRYAIYYLLILGIYVMHAQQQTFIYFQF